MVPVIAPNVIASRWGSRRGAWNVHLTGQEIISMGIRDREVYQSDQGIRVGRVPVLFAGGLAAALASAWLLQVVHTHNMYFIVVAPLLAGLLTGGGLLILVAWSKCRNRGLATVLGLVAGLVTFLGYYQFCLVRDSGMGLQLLTRVDLLPQYIQFRLQNDIVEEVGPNPAKVAPGPRAGQSIMNSFLFVFELLCCVFPAALAANQRAGRAFSPASDRWMKKESISFRHGAAAMLQEGLERDALGEVLPNLPPASDVRTDTLLTLEYSSDGSPFDEPIYATIEEYGPFNLKSLGRNRYPVIRQIELTTAETLHLAPLFKGLSQSLAASHEELRGVALQSPAVRRVAANTSDVAIIEPVPEPFQNKVRTKGYAIWVNLIDLIPLLVMAAGGGLAFLGGQWISQGRMLAVAIPTLVVGIVLGVLGMYVAGFQVSLLTNRWIRKRLLQELRLRPDPWIDLSEETTYMSLIPRENFAVIKLTLSSDLMLCQLRDSQLDFVLEGDSNRYRIPMGAISICEPELFYSAADPQKNIPIWTVRLMVSVPEGSRELLLSVNSVHMEWNANKKREIRAQEWCQRINQLLQVSRSG
jgi:hypothetical protein